MFDFFQRFVLLQDLRTEISRECCEDNESEDACSTSDEEDKDVSYLSEEERKLQRRVVLDYLLFSVKGFVYRVACRPVSNVY